MRVIPSHVILLEQLMFLTLLILLESLHCHDMLLLVIPHILMLLLLILQMHKQMLHYSFIWNPSTTIYKHWW